MEMLVLSGLRRKLGCNVEIKVACRQCEAKLRNGYRELFQDKDAYMLTHSLRTWRRLIYATCSSSGAVQRS
ncbi:hypothetical protein BKA82DRAFT_1006516 [Pisolithus tinctorius]|uniref:Uncharacterized protein n=1 Tax=Pisolithus tinctorius Marx 270 TaxID=870435 RepID=A0A0C3N6X0_PISTI|nr:hypothetical protein BKA82DRAFT_1006516 [Pisolithus tinctorius]KIN96804.1 hypothetical protein M404DRAFT_1006516 [Pisolithus tinctorius Marx 270]